MNKRDEQIKAIADAIGRGFEETYLAIKESDSRGFSMDRVMEKLGGELLGMRFVEVRDTTSDGTYLCWDKRSVWVVKGGQPERLFHRVYRIERAEP